MAILKVKKGAKDHRVNKMKDELREHKALNLMIDAKTLKDFKVKVTKEETTMTDVITGFILEYLDGMK